MPIVSVYAVSKREDTLTLIHRNSCTYKPLEEKSSRKRRDSDIA